MRQIATKPPELTEGPQRRDGQLGPSWPDLSCTAQHEGIEILRPDAYRRERAMCGPVREESDDLMQLIVDRGLTHSAFLREIFHEGVFQSSLRIPRQTRSGRRNGAGLPEVGQELLQHGAIPPAQSTSSTRAIAGELCEPSFIHETDTQALSIEPAVQVAKQPELVPGVDPAIPLLEEESREPIDVAGQRATPETLDGARVREELCRHRSNLRRHQRVGCAGR